MKNFNDEEWCARIQQTKTLEDLITLVMELPSPPSDSLNELLAKMDAAETPEALDEILFSIPKGGPNGLQLNEEDWLRRVKCARTTAEKVWLYGDYPALFR